MSQTRPMKLALVLGLVSAGFGAGRLFVAPSFVGPEPNGVKDALESAQLLSEAYQEISRRVAPSVVSVTAFEIRESRFGSRLRQRQQGSGVIVREDGIVVTNNHVVQGADKLVTTLADGRELITRVIGTDADTDLAVLGIEGRRFEATPISTREPVVGEWVLAMGNPFGYGHTVTTGIVSGKGRTDLEIATYEDFLQTDAAINPGNSGGPLVDLHGEVLGINTAIGTRASGSQGIGFAIPSHMVRWVVDAILADGRVRRGYLGVVMNDGAREVGYEGRSRVLVTQVLGPAKDAGLLKGDVILAVDDRNIVRRNDLLNMIAEFEPGTRVAVDLWRDGRKLSLPVYLGERDTF